MTALALAVAASVLVPLDHADPRSPRLELGYELGAPFDPAKPTVVLVTDGQQFRVAPGRMEREQRELFGEGFNVVGLYGRGATPEFQRAALGADGEVDWRLGYTIFRAGQWVEDIDAVRRHLLGAEGKVALYGASGGALLVHQYLARHGRWVTRAFTAATVEPWVVGALRLRTDRFWEDLGTDDRARLQRALAARAADRDLAVLLLQRQNFFVPPGRLAGERSALIRALESGDAVRLAALRREYQVDAVRELMASPRGIAIRVREYEFALPAGEAERLRAPGVHPDLEVHAMAARPLLDLHAAGRLPAPAFDGRAAHGLSAEVLVLAGVRDHTADWRASIAVAARYPAGTLLVVDDDHTFKRLKDSGGYSALLRGFLAGGAAGDAFRTALSDVEPLRWRE